MVYEGTLSPSSSTATDDVTSTKKQSPVSPSSSAARRSSDRSASARPKKRVKSGCLTCRKRRVKCGEEKPICKNCIKRGKPCVYGCNKIKWPDMTALESQALTDRVEVDLLAMMNQGCFHSNNSMTPPTSTDGSWSEGPAEQPWSHGFPLWQPPQMPFQQPEQNWTQHHVQMSMHRASAPVSPYFMRERQAASWSDASGPSALPIDPCLELATSSTALDTPMTAFIPMSTNPYTMAPTSYFPLQTDFKPDLKPAFDSSSQPLDSYAAQPPYNMQFFESMLHSASTDDTSPRGTQASSVISFDDPRNWENDKLYNES